MKNLLNSIVVTLIFVLFNSLQAQDQYTIIHKNLNSTASGLHHNLNKSGDTIVMTSDKSILRVSFLSHEQKETVMIDLDNKVAKIPLYHLPIGRYTIAVYREDMIIAYPSGVFHESMARSMQQGDKKCKILEVSCRIYDDQNEENYPYLPKPTMHNATILH